MPYYIIICWKRVTSSSSLSGKAYEGSKEKRRQKVRVYMYVFAFLDEAYYTWFILSGFEWKYSFVGAKCQCVAFFFLNRLFTSCLLIHVTGRSCARVFLFIFLRYGRCRFIFKEPKLWSNTVRNVINRFIIKFVRLAAGASFTSRKFI